MLRAGDRVRVDGATTWTIGRVEEIRTGAARVALISFASGGGERKIFAATESLRGWTDLNGQPLSITLAGK